MSETYNKNLSISCLHLYVESRLKMITIIIAMGHERETAWRKEPVEGGKEEYRKAWVST
jgi:hypothetical protein